MYRGRAIEKADDPSPAFIAKIDRLLFEQLYEA